MAYQVKYVLVMTTRENPDEAVKIVYLTVNN